MDASPIEDHNSNLDCSLSKSLSTPKKCSYCQKMIYFKTYKCKHCRYKCHKTCASSNGSRRNSTHKGQYAVGEEHWSKVLQASEINSNLVSLPSNSKHALHHICRCGCPKSRRGSSSSKKNPKKDSNFFTSLYERFVEWVHNARKDSPYRPTSSASRCSSFSSATRSRSSSKGSLDLYSYKISTSTSGDSPDDMQRCYHTSVSSTDSDIGSYLFHRQASHCSSWTFTSTSTSAASDWPPGCASPLSLTSSQSSYTDINHVIASQDTVSPLPLNTSETPRHPRQHRFRQISTNSYQVPHSRHSDEDSHEGHALCATWPPGSTQRLDADYEARSGSVSDTEIDTDTSVFIDDDHRDRLSEEELRETLAECSIPFTDIELTECLRVGRRHEIHRGRWHGDVVVYKYSDRGEADVTSFLKEVSRMSMLRHENVTLFMGACLQPPHLAVVNSDVKGTSLYANVHFGSDKMSLRFRVNIVRHVALGMGYLHAKGIVLKNLTSRNIYLEGKVKICLMDHGMAEKQYDRPGYGCLSRGTLCYLAPELLRSLQIEPPWVQHTSPCTTATDVYAFGTLMYEVLSGHFPFQRCPPESIIWQAANGRHPCVSHLRCNSRLKHLVQECWSCSFDERPTFEDINARLQGNNALHKRHSSSEPDNISRVGTSQSSILLSP